MAIPLTQQIVDSDPEIQAYLHGANPHAGTIEDYNRAVNVLAPLLQRKGYTIPDGMTLSPKTRKLEGEGGGFNPWLAAATLAGPAVAGLTGPAGVAAKAGTGVASKMGTQGTPGYNPNDTGTGPLMPSGTGNSGGAGGATKALAILGGLLAGKLLQNHDSQANVPPQLSQLLQMGVDRTAAQNPLFNAANSGIYQMLPNFARQGTTPPPMLGSQAPAPTAMPTSGNSGGGMNPALMALLGAGGGIGLAGLLTGTNPYGSIIDGLKKLFGGKQQADLSQWTPSQQTTPTMATGLPPGSHDYGPETTVPDLHLGAADLIPKQPSTWDFGTQIEQIPLLPDDTITSWGG